MTRSKAIEIATTAMDSGAFFRDLERRVNIPSDSQTSTDTTTLMAYVNEEMRSTLEALGFGVTVYDNPVKGAGPFMIAERIESPDAPTVLISTQN